MKTMPVFLLSTFCLSSFATDLTFLNNSDKDATLVLAFKQEAGSQTIFAPARKSTKASVDSLLQQAHSPDTWLWIIASVGKNPSADTFCTPRVQVKDMRGSNKSWKVKFRNDTCTVEK